jgi:plastocyanin
MGLRRCAFLLVCALLGSAVAVLPAVAGSETTPTVNAVSNATCGYYPNCWSPSQVEVTAPGTVTFANASGVAHGVVWNSVPATPSCSGVPVNSSATSFNGTCSFSQPGTYTFYCYVHGPSMSGTITVSPTGTTTATTTTETQPGTTTTTTSLGTKPTPTSPSSPPGASFPQPAGLAGPIVAVARSQRGRLVRGSLEVPAADAAARLEVDLLARGAALSSAGGSSAVRVGRLVRSTVGPGKLAFSVALNARARATLARRHRLQLIVKVVLTPAHGSPSAISRNVLLHS